MSIEIPENKEERKKPDFTLFRHQESHYHHLKKILLESDDPRSPVSPEDQEFGTELTEKGKEESRREAIAFFSENDFKPEEDAFFFASSDFVRAPETGKIYLDVAEEMGFEIITPEKPGSPVVEKVGDGKIKHLENLSLHLEDALIDQLFNPKNDFLEMALDRGIDIDEDLVGRWREARGLIEDNNKGTWTDNWREHSEKVKEIIPEINTPKEMFETQFKNLIRLIEYGKKKIESSGHTKKIRVLAFTHENLFTHWLSEHWNEPGMNLGEGALFYYDEDEKLRAQVREKDQPVEVDEKEEY